MIFMITYLILFHFKNILLSHNVAQSGRPALVKLCHGVCFDFYSSLLAAALFAAALKTKISYINKHF